MPDAERLAELYAAAAGRARDALLAVDPAKYSLAAAARAMSEVRAAIQDLDQDAVAWGDQAIDESWEKGAATATTALEILGKTRLYEPELEGREALKDALAKTLLKANRSIVRSAQDFLALTAMGAKAIAGAELQEFDFEGAEARMTGLARDAVKNESSRKVLAGQIRKDLASEISAGNLIQIKGKQWQADRYAEMVARTTLREAQTEATLELCREYDNDLVEVSSHGTVCMLCHDYEGQIYSISGKHPVYPALQDSPPYHPNCEHSLLPTSDPALDVRRAGPGKSGSYLEGAPWLVGPVVVKTPPMPKKRKPPKPKLEQPKAPVIKKELTPWAPAQTIDEATAWAKQELCIGEVDYSQCSVEIANLINKEMDYIRRFGYKFDQMVPDSDRHSVAYIWRRSRGGKEVVDFAYNPTSMGNMTRLNSTIRGLSFSTCIGETPQTLIWHEMAHALDDFWCRANGVSWWGRSRSWELWESWKGQAQFQGVTGQAMRKVVERRIRDRYSGSYMWVMREKGQKNVHEFFAEAYRLYRQNALPPEMKYMAEKFKGWGW